MRAAANRRDDRLSLRALKRMRHDLLTPFIALHQALSLLSDGVSGPVSEPQRELLDVAQRNLQRLEGQMDVLLRALEAEQPASSLAHGQPRRRRPRRRRPTARRGR